MRAVVAFALLASLSACKKKEDTVASKPPPSPIKVTTAAVQEVPTPQVLVLTGVIAADQRSEVTADTQGKVISVLVERGQRVKMGQPVVQLDVRNAALSAREAQANLAGARAQKQLAEEECKREQVLFDKGAITRSDYDRQMTQCTSTLEQVSAAQARTDAINKSVSDGLVRAPFDGQVTEKSVAPGEWVAPGKTLFTLVDDDPLRIELSVPEAAVRAVQKGQKVELTAVAQPDKRYMATVTRIGAEIGKSRALVVEATLDPQTDLVPGMFAEAGLVVGQASRPIVPKTAVVKRGKLAHVFTVLGGEIQDKIVEVQEYPEPAPGMVTILKGLEKGADVVTQPSEQTVDGAKVQVEGAAPAAAAATKPAAAPAEAKSAEAKPAGGKE